MYSIIQKIYEKNNKILKEGFKRLTKKLLTSFKSFDMIMKLFGSQAARKKNEKVVDKLLDTW